MQKRFVFIKVLTVLSLIVFALTIFGCAKKKPRKKPQKVVKIAAIFPITGPNAAIGTGLMNSVQLAVDQANDLGKLKNIKLELMKLDDASDPAQAVNVAIKATSDPDVVAVTAFWNSPCALATVDIFHRTGVVCLVASAISNKITLGNDYDEIFRFVPHDIVQSQYAAKFAVESNKFKNIFIIDDSTAFGKSLATLFKQYATEYGGKIVGEDSITVGEKDFTPLLTKVKNINPELVFFATVPTEGALIKSQMDKLKITAEAMGGSNIVSETYINVAGEVAEGTIASMYRAPYEEIPGGLAYIKSYNKAGFDKPYESYGIFGYCSAQVLIETIRKVGPNRKAIIEEMKKGTFNTAVGKVAFDKNGDNKLITIAFYIVKNGKWIVTHKVDRNGNIVPAH